MRRRDGRPASRNAIRSEEHTSELQSLMRKSYAVFCLKKKKKNKRITNKKKNNDNKSKSSNTLYKEIHTTNNDTIIQSKRRLQAVHNKNRMYYMSKTSNN